MSNHSPPSPTLSEHEPSGYWEVVSLPAVSPFSDTLDVVSAWWKILSHYVSSKQIRIVPKSIPIPISDEHHRHEEHPTLHEHGHEHRNEHDLVQTLVVEAISVRHHGMSKSKTTPLFILEYCGPEHASECLDWEPHKSSFHGSLSQIVHRDDLEHIYIGLAIGEYVKFWKVEMEDGKEGAWVPLADDLERQDTFDCFDVADWHDKLKIHKFMGEIRAYVHEFCDHPVWSLD